MKPVRPFSLRIALAVLAVVLVSLVPSAATAGDAAKFVSETIPDNTIILAGGAFSKTWTLRNTGDTTWDSTYVLRFASGANLSDHPDVRITGTVAPNATYTFSKEIQTSTDLRNWRPVARSAQGQPTTLRPVAGGTLNETSDPVNSAVTVRYQGPAGTGTCYYRLAITADP